MFVRGVAAVGLFLMISTSLTLPARAEGYSRKIAIAPFGSLSQDNIAATVAVLPRLLASRLMALAGAEVLLVPADSGDPAGSAKAAGYPLLLEGTVSKLGKGYSIDVATTDLGTGKPAGAFYVAAGTEDDIIPRLGDLAADIAEKLFAVKPQVKAPPPQLPLQPAPPAPGGSPSGAAPVSPPAVAPAAAVPPPVVPAGPWEPKSIVKVAMSDKIPDTIFRVSSGDVDGDGIPEVAAIGSRRLFVYTVRDDKAVFFRKLEKDPSHLFLNVEVADLDGDGKGEIVVTDLHAGNLKTFVLNLRGDALEPAASELPYFVLSLDDGKGGRRLAGQKIGLSEPYSGNVVYLRWDPGKKTLVPDGEVPVRISEGVFGLAVFPGDSEKRFLYLDGDEHVRIVNEKGKTTYKTKEYYSGAVHLFTWGKETRSNVGPDRHYVRGRIVPIVREGLPPLFIVRQAKGSTVFRDLRSFDWSRLVLLSWDGDGFSEKAGSEKIDNLMTDFAVVGTRAAAGTRLVVPVADWTVSPFSGSEGATRLHIYRIE